MAWSWVIFKFLLFLILSLFILVLIAFNCGTADGFEKQCQRHFLSAKHNMMHFASQNIERLSMISSRFVDLSSDLIKENWFPSSKRDSAVCLCVLLCLNKIPLLHTLVDFVCYQLHVLPHTYKTLWIITDRNSKHLFTGYGCKLCRCRAMASVSFEECISILFESCALPTQW